MKIIYIFVQSMKLNTETCLHLYCFCSVLFFCCQKLLIFIQKLNQLTLSHPCHPGCCNTFRFYFLSLLIDSHSFVFILNWVVFWHFSFIMVCWEFSEACSHLLLLCFSDAIFPVNCISFVYVLFSLLQSFRASCLCSRRRTYPEQHLQEKHNVTSHCDVRPW